MSRRNAEKKQNAQFSTSAERAFGLGHQGGGAAEKTYDPFIRTLLNKFEPSQSCQSSHGAIRALLQAILEAHTLGDPETALQLTTTLRKFLEKQCHTSSAGELMTDAMQTEVDEYEQIMRNQDEWLSPEEQRQYMLDSRKKKASRQPKNSTRG